MQFVCFVYPFYLHPTDGHFFSEACSKLYKISVHKNVRNFLFSFLILFNAVVCTILYEILHNHTTNDKSVRVFETEFFFVIIEFERPWSILLNIVQYSTNKPNTCPTQFYTNTFYFVYMLLKYLYFCINTKYSCL